MTKIKVQIDRAKWRCGGDGYWKTGQGTTQLENSEGFMCCLGFITKHQQPTVDVLGLESPESVDALIPDLNDYNEVTQSYDNTVLTWKAMEINDDSMKSCHQRECELRELFEPSVYELEFVGEYND